MRCTERIGCQWVNGSRPPHCHRSRSGAHFPMTMPSETTLYKRLGSHAKLAVLVQNFYASLQIHPTLGPIFAAHVQSWPAHYARLTEFWALQTGGPSQYRGRLLRTHDALGLRPEDFETWLAQWRQSCRLHFEEPEATEIIALTEILAMLMEGGG